MENKEIEQEAYLYHFTKAESLLKILDTDSFLMNNIKGMNDIKERRSFYNGEWITELGYFCVNSNMAMLEEEICTKMDQVVEDAREHTFIGCFNKLKGKEEIEDKHLLWSHYTNIYSGVAIKINKNKLEEILVRFAEDNNEIHHKLLAINYYSKESNQETFIKRKACRNLPFIENEIEKKAKAIFDTYSWKSDEWEKENETRIIIYAPEKEERIILETFTLAIEEVICGCEMDKTNKNLIKMMVKQLEEESKGTINIRIRDYKIKRFDDVSDVKESNKYDEVKS